MFWISLDIFPKLESVDHTYDKGLISWIYKELYNSTPKKVHFYQKWLKNLKRHFSKEDIQMVNRHMKRCSMPLIIREMQIKTTRRNHLPPVRMAVINKSAKSMCWCSCVQKGTSICFWWECRLVLYYNFYSFIESLFCKFFLKNFFKFLAEIFLISLKSLSYNFNIWFTSVLA